MAKKPVKKAAAKKTSGTTRRAATKKTSSKSTKKVPVKRVITDRERDQRAANLIANTEKKNLAGSKTKRPKKTVTKKQAISLLDAIVEGMQEKKAKNIVTLNLSAIENRVCDYFVICDADSSTHVAAIADSIEETVIKLTGEKAYHSEGRQNSEWVLVDYINIVAHVFLRETREYYNIEALWGDAEATWITN
jgi:ribosome-associated protein